MEGSSSGIVRKGAWSQCEDNLLRECVNLYGEGKWHLVPQRAGLNRCRKSCRLRRLNYLKPDIKRGDFSEEEVDLMIRLHKLLGNRWSLIAGRLPGRTSNDVKNYWNTYIRRKVVLQKSRKKDNDDEHNNDVNMAMVTVTPTLQRVQQHQVIKPVPRTLTKTTASPFFINTSSEVEGVIRSSTVEAGGTGANSSGSEENWWETLLFEEDNNNAVLNSNNSTCFFVGGALDELWDEEINPIANCDDDEQFFLTQGENWSDFLLHIED